ncbi:MAG: hypothetical protein ACNA8L_04735 [Luteolibacter sp.]|jgi:hypothetical protein
MAARPPTPEIQALIARSDAARGSLAGAAVELRAKLDVPARLLDSMRSHPARWLTGGTITGLIASRLLFRRPRANRVRKPRSILFFLLRMASDAAMPAVKIWLLAQIKDHLTRRTANPQPPLSF